jgi:hypothetical protein
MAVPASNADRLTAAIDARHQLLVGAKAVSVEVAGGMRVTFTPANREALESYISELQSAIDGTQTRGAIGFVF